MKLLKEKRLKDTFTTIGTALVFILIRSIIIFALALLISLITSTFLNMKFLYANQGSIIADMISGVIAAIAAGLVLYELYITG